MIDLVHHAITECHSSLKRLGLIVVSPELRARNFWGNVVAKISELSMLDHASFEAKFFEMTGAYHNLPATLKRLTIDFVASKTVDLSALSDVLLGESFVARHQRRLSIVLRASIKLDSHRETTKYYNKLQASLRTYIIALACQQFRDPDTEVMAAAHPT